MCYQCIDQHSYAGCVGARFQTEYFDRADAKHARNGIAGYHLRQLRAHAQIAAIWAFLLLKIGGYPSG